MFGFEFHEDGSEERFFTRAVEAKEEEREAGHFVWWIVHNCISHPLIGILPIGPFFRFHDWTSHKMGTRAK